MKETYPALRQLGLDSSCWIWPSITQVQAAAEGDTFVACILSLCQLIVRRCTPPLARTSPAGGPPSPMLDAFLLQNAYQTAEVLAELHGVGRNRVRCLRWLALQPSRPAHVMFW